MAETFVKMMKGYMESFQDWYLNGQVRLEKEHSVVISSLESFKSRSLPAFLCVLTGNDKNSGRSENTPAAVI